MHSSSILLVNILQIIIHYFVISGALADALGSYKFPYYMCVAMAATSGMLFQLEIVIQKIVERKERNRNKVKDAVSSS